MSDSLCPHLLYGASEAESNANDPPAACGRGVGLDRAEPVTCVACPCRRPCPSATPWPVPDVPPLTLSDGPQSPVAAVAADPWPPAGPAPDGPDAPLLCVAGP